jgi:signal transduction histidine kinase
MRVSPLALFLGGTLVLAGWLGYQAFDAAVSHRRTAEAVLSDYALISATEMARIANRRIDDILDEVFRPVSDRRFRRLGDVPPERFRYSLAEAMDEHRCDCPGFRDPVAVFLLEHASQELEIIPDTLPAALADRLRSLVQSLEPAGRESEGLIVLPPAAESDVPLVLGFAVPDDPDGADAATYGFLVHPAALGDLFAEWYAEERLLPRPIAPDQPNDSVLHVTVTAPDGIPIFASPLTLPPETTASASVGSEYGDLVVRAAVRPEAASQLIIGGLPRSRLPLLTMLLLLTLGVGVAAVVQLRREQGFQRLRDDFVSGVSHELRTPLAQIRMFAELQEAGKLVSEEDRARATSVIHRESIRLTHLVENILQFSRLRHAPEQRLPKERLELAEGMAEGIDAVTPLLEDRAMRLDLVAEPDLPVLANREALTRIIVNLLDNAVKYGPKGQEVEVRLSRTNGSARLSVADQGPGIPPGDWPRVWNPYYRLDRDVKAHIPGTGMGLSVVARLAEFHGGRVWVEEADGGGARFVVEIPLATERTAGNNGSSGA